MMYVSPAETIDTVNVSTSSFDAEQGMAGGAAVTVITKSGTNEFRGSAFEGFNNDKLNAKPYFFGAGPAPDKLPVKTQQLRRDGRRADQARTRCSSSGRSKATSARRASSPSSACRTRRCAPATSARRSTRTDRCRPSTTRSRATADGTGRQPFANNQIPAEHDQPDRAEDPAAVPDAEHAGHRRRRLTNNYQRQEDRTVDRENYDVKLNWNRTSTHQLWAKFSHMNAVVDDLTNYLGPDPNATGDGGNTKVYQFTAGQTWTLSPTLLMDTTFGFSRQKQDVLGPDFNAGNFGLDVARHSGHERSGHRRPALRRLSRVPVRRHDLGLLQPARQPRRLEPDLPRRADVLARAPTSRR